MPVSGSPSIVHRWSDTRAAIAGVVSSETDHVTPSTEADFELAGCSTGTPVPLRVQIQQERI